MSRKKVLGILMTFILITGLFSCLTGISAEASTLCSVSSADNSQLEGVWRSELINGGDDFIHRLYLIIQKNGDVLIYNKDAMSVWDSPLETYGGEWSCRGSQITFRMQMIGGRHANELMSKRPYSKFNTTFTYIPDVSGNSMTFEASDAPFFAGIQLQSYTFTRITYEELNECDRINVTEDLADAALWFLQSSPVNGILNCDFTAVRTGCLSVAEVVYQMEGSYYYERQQIWDALERQGNTLDPNMSMTFCDGSELDRVLKAALGAGLYEIMWDMDRVLYDTEHDVYAVQHGDINYVDFTCSHEIADGRFRFDCTENSTGRRFIAVVEQTVKPYNFRLVSVETVAD